MNAPVKPTVRLESARRHVPKALRSANAAFYRRGRVVFQYGSNTSVAWCEDAQWAARVVACLNLQIANGALAAGIVPEKVQ